MLTILIVEDEANIRHFVSVNLKARGYETLLAESAEDGLHLLRTLTPDALILDIKLPGMTGWDMLNVIDHEPTLPKLPVIIMTASSVLSQPDEYHYANVVAKLIKPVSVADLLQAIRLIPQF